MTTVILDDSKDAGSRDHIDRVAAELHARVLRRGDRSGYKAGNLNHALGLLQDDFDYVAVLDSDSRLPPEFITRALQEFATAADIGIVQAAHRAAPARTPFTREFAELLGTHIAVTQSARAAAGFSAYMGTARSRLSVLRGEIGVAATATLLAATLVGTVAPVAGLVLPAAVGAILLGLGSRNSIGWTGRGLRRARPEAATGA